MAQVGRQIEQEVERLTREVTEGLGLSVYDIVFRRSGPRWKLQVFLSHPQRPVSLDDCEKVSRQLSRELDVEDPIPHAYDLEVSSPGMDRPLRRADHFAAAAGETIRLKYREAGGAARTVTARLEGVQQDELLVSLSDGEQEIRVPLTAVLSARIQPDW